MLLCLTVLFFAEAYYLLAQTPGQLTDLRTKTDALYFTVTTLSTVGYGDVHAAGQLARVAVTLQIVYDLVFIGLAVAVGGQLLRAKAAQRPPRHGEQTKTPSETAPGSGAPESGPGSAWRFSSCELKNAGATARRVKVARVDSDLVGRWLAVAARGGSFTQYECLPRPCQLIDRAWLRPFSGNASRTALIWSAAVMSPLAYPVGLARGVATRSAGYSARQSDSFRYRRHCRASVCWPSHCAYDLDSSGPGSTPPDRA